MATPDWSQLLKIELNCVESRFSSDELAYLALTSKIEHPFRDRLAFGLHTALAGEPEFTVSREWRRVDLAILKNKHPVMLLELKAMYSFDMHGRTAPIVFPSAVQNDVRKLQTIAAAFGTQPPMLFTLLLATHPHAVPQANLNGVVKYASGIRSRTPTDPTTLDARICENFAHTVAASGTVQGGSAFGIDVSLYYWLFGPYEVRPTC